MSEPGCIRGCTLRDGRHLAACADYGRAEAHEQAAAYLPAKDRAEYVPTCAGCVPVGSRDGAMICDRCYRAAERVIEDLPDLIAHLRSIADPTKAVVYDRIMVSSSRPDIPAPVAADLLDSSNDLMRTLREWALFVQFPGQGWHAAGLEAGIDAADAFDDANGCARVVLGALPAIANSTEVRALCEALLTRHNLKQPVPWWSAVDALTRWPLDDRVRWANTECPNCTCKTVRVFPPRRAGMPARFDCTTCTFSKTDRDDDGLWAEAFAEVVPPMPAPDDDPDESESSTDDE